MVLSNSANVALGLAVWNLLVYAGRNSDRALNVCLQFLSLCILCEALAHTPVRFLSWVPIVPALVGIIMLLLYYIAKYLFIHVQHNGHVI